MCCTTTIKYALALIKSKSITSGLLQAYLHAIALPLYAFSKKRFKVKSLSNSPWADFSVIEKVSASALSVLSDLPTVTAALGYAVHHYILFDVITRSRLHLTGGERPVGKGGDDHHCAEGGGP